jgi:hypothetical protein
MAENKCEQCGELIERCPCPYCGWTSVVTGVGALVAGGARMSATGKVFTYPEWLLETAKEQIKGSHFEAAIVVSAMACEIATEAVISAALKELHPGIAGAVDNLLNGYSLSNDRTCKLYSALTGDEIDKDKPFFDDYVKAVPVARNKAIHNGERFTKNDADSAVSLASQMLKRLNPT